jgi:hypothetical protein
MPIQLVEDGPEERIRNTGMKFLQLPILIHHCTTVNKLQGQTKENLLVTSWNYSGSWVYVALSRVQSLDRVLRTKTIRTLRRNIQRLSIISLNALT